MLPVQSIKEWRSWGYSEIPGLWPQNRFCASQDWRKLPSFKSQLHTKETAKIGNSAWIINISSIIYFSQSSICSKFLWYIVLSKSVFWAENIILCWNIGKEYLQQKLCQLRNVHQNPLAYMKLPASSAWSKRSSSKDSHRSYGRFWWCLMVLRTQMSWQSQISESQWHNGGSLKEITDWIGLPSLTS